MNIDVLIKIVSFLNKSELDYTVIGGLASKIYGGKRRVYDFDIGVTIDTLALLRKEFHIYILKDHISGYSDELWKLNIVIFKIDSQIVDLFDVDTLQFYSKETGKFEKIRFNQRVNIDFKGMELKVINLEELLRYKKLLGRDVDLLDIRELEGKSKNGG